jgi:hypothetical protein
VQGRIGQRIGHPPDLSASGTNGKRVRGRLCRAVLSFATPGFTRAPAPFIDEAWLPAFADVAAMGG